MAGPRRKPVPAGKRPAPAATTAPAVVAPVVDTATPPPAAPPPSGQDDAGMTNSGETATTTPIATVTIAGLLPAPATAAADASDAGTAIVADGTPNTPPATEAASVPPADVDARVLVAFGDLDVNAVATASPAEIERLANAGMVDPHPDAVAAARALTA